MTRVVADRARGLALVIGALISASGIVRAQPTPTPDPSPTPTPDPNPTPNPTPTANPNPNPTPTPTPTPTPAPTEPFFHAPALQLHGFVSQGAYITTANNYFGTDDDRGSLELFEAGLNVSAELGDRLRAGIQLYARNAGSFDDLPPRLDWAYVDYRWRPQLGFRAGVIKMPFGLSNEYADIDAARVPILLPQSVYSLRNRSALLALTGAAVYGEAALGGAGELSYQAWLGTLVIPENALIVDGATLDGIDTRYVTGGQVFWSPPVDGLRIGASYIRTSIDFDIQLSDATVATLVALGVVPADYDGELIISQRPTQFWVASVEYVHGDWMIQAEYARSYKHQLSSLPLLVPTTDDDNERFYALATHRFDRYLEAGAYYSVFHVDPDDRDGSDRTVFPEDYYAFQRDAAATLRFDATDAWVWKLEAHFIHGVADLPSPDNPDPEPYWGMFLVKTTVTF